LLRVEPLALDATADVAVDPPAVFTLTVPGGVWERCAEPPKATFGHSAALDTRACASASVIRATAAAMSKLSCSGAGDELPHLLGTEQRGKVSARRNGRS